jgi:putative FmdB family regulatory protein
MPTYEYACKKCREHLEVVQSFKDEPLTECPHCGGELRKVFGNVGIVFKGSGFYKTDSRPAAKKESKTSAKTESTTESKSSDSKSSDSKTADAKSSDGNSSDSKTKPEKSAAAAS